MSISTKTFRHSLASVFDNNGLDWSRGAGSAPWEWISGPVLDPGCGPSRNREGGPRVPVRTVGIAAGRLLSLCYEALRPRSSPRRQSIQHPALAGTYVAGRSGRPGETGSERSHRSLIQHQGTSREGG